MGDFRGIFGDIHNMCLLMLFGRDHGLSRLMAAATMVAVDNRIYLGAFALFAVAEQALS